MIDLATIAAKAWHPRTATPPAPAPVTVHACPRCGGPLSERNGVSICRDCYQARGATVKGQPCIDCGAVRKGSASPRCWACHLAHVRALR